MPSAIAATVGAAPAPNFNSAAPRRGSTGMRASWRPKVVMAPAVFSAPIACSASVACVRAAAGAGSSSGRSGEPQACIARSAPVRSLVAISGAASGLKCANSASEYARITVPGPRRPARPARWFALDFDAETVISPVIPRASRRGSRDRPASTTRCTPGTVTDDSAIAVATTTGALP